MKTVLKLRFIIMISTVLINFSCGSFHPQVGIPSLLVYDELLKVLWPSDYGVTINHSGAGGYLIEGSTGDTYTLVLNKKPLSDVVLQATPDSQLLINGSSGKTDLIFTPTDWNLAQTLRVDAIDDSLVEGNHSGKISHIIAEGDSSYLSISLSDIIFEIVDNDSPGIVLSKTNISVNEGGATDSYTVVLDHQPAFSVNITVSPDSQTTVNGFASDMTLTFTPSDWSVAQTVIVGAQTDTVTEGSHSGTINHSVSSSDSAYAAINPPSVNVNITDCPFPTWTRRRKITIDNSAQGKSLLNFPILVKLNGSNIDYSQTQDLGEDIRFLDSDGITTLPHEIEKWDESGDSFVWVKVPQIDGASDTDYIWIYYGNASAGDGQSPTNVWNSDFETVLHHNGTFNDSTPNGNNGTPYNGPGDINASIIGGGKEFLSASSQYYVMPTHGWSNKEGTVEAWIYPYTSAGNGIVRYVISHRFGNTSSRIYLTQYNATDFMVGIGDCFVWNSCGDTGLLFSLNNWQHLVMTWNNGVYSIYFNGTEVIAGSTYNASDMVIDSIAYVSRYAGADQEHFNGIIDEVRVSSVPRSADWVAAEYKTMTNAFLSFGPEELL